MRILLHDFDERGFGVLLRRLPERAFRRSLTRRDVKELWDRRNDVMHRGEDLAVSSEAEKYAAKVVHGVVEFIENNKLSSE